MDFIFIDKAETVWWTKHFCLDKGRLRLPRESIFYLETKKEPANGKKWDTKSVRAAVAYYAIMWDASETDR